MSAVRPLTADDRSAWEPLFAGYLRFYRAEPTPAWNDDTFTRLVGPDASVTGLLAVSLYDTVAGLTSFRVNEHEL